MKKASILFSIIALGACAGWLFGQETQEFYSYTFEKGVGTCTFKGVSLDQVWSAAIKALMQDKFKIESSEKQSGNIAAERGRLTTGHETYGLNLFFEQRGQDVCIISSIYELATGNRRGFMGPKSFAHKMEKKFYDNVAELLYGKVEKK